MHRSRMLFVKVWLSCIADAARLEAGISSFPFHNLLPYARCKFDILRTWRACRSLLDTILFCVIMKRTMRPLMPTTALTFLSSKIILLINMLWWLRGPARMKWPFTEKDVMLYALSIGCHRDEKRYVYENDKKFSPLPTFPVLALHNGALESMDMADYVENFNPVGLYSFVWAFPEMWYLCLNFPWDMISSLWICFAPLFSTHGSCKLHSRIWRQFNFTQNFWKSSAPVYRSRIYEILHGMYASFQKYFQSL